MQQKYSQEGSQRSSPGEWSGHRKRSGMEPRVKLGVEKQVPGEQSQGQSMSHIQEQGRERSRSGPIKMQYGKNYNQQEKQRGRSRPVVPVILAIPAGPWQRIEDIAGERRPAAGPM